MIIIRVVRSLYDVLTSKNTFVKVFKSSINSTNFSLLFKIPPLPEGRQAVIGHNFETYCTPCLYWTKEQRLLKKVCSSCYILLQIWRELVASLPSRILSMAASYKMCNRHDLLSTKNLGSHLTSLKKDAKSLHWRASLYLIAQWWYCCCPAQLSQPNRSSEINEGLGMRCTCLQIHFCTFLYFYVFDCSVMILLLHSTEAQK